MLAFRKALGILVSLLALIGLLVTGVLASRRIDLPPRTDDAYLQADLVHLAPDVSGRIVELDMIESFELSSLRDRKAPQQHKPVLRYHRSNDASRP